VPCFRPSLGTASLRPFSRAAQGEGRPRVSDRAALNGILYMLRTDIQWKHLPTELGFDSGVTVWRRVLAWRRAGVWERLHRLLLDEFGGSRATGLDAGGGRYAQATGQKGGCLTGPNATDCGKSDSKQHAPSLGQKPCRLRGRRRESAARWRFRPSCT
jgi:transposase